MLAEPVLAWKAAHEAQREREREAAEAERRHKRLLRLLAVAAAALLVMAGVTVFAVTQWSKARSQARLAHGRELAGEAVAELNVDPLDSLALALRSAQAQAHEPEPRTSSARPSWPTASGRSSRTTAPYGRLPSARTERSC